MADEDPYRQDRRSQKDRSESMQKRVLDATLKCIGAHGYHGVSLQDIADEAGVSRGAITHHYISKVELVAAAISHFVQWRYVKLQAAFEGRESLSLRERLDILWDEFQEIFPIGFALIVALRSDKELLALYNRKSKGGMDDIALGYDGFFPELGNAGLPSVVISVMMAFYRGTYIESVARDPEYVASMKRTFDDMLLSYMQTYKKAA